MLCPLQPQRNTAMWVPGGFGADDDAEDLPTAARKMGAEEMERALAEILNRFGLTDAAPEMLHDLASKDPRLFFAAGVARLQLEGGPPGHRKRSLRLLDTPSFLLELVRSDLFSTLELKDFCGKYIREDSLLDVKLARLMPGRQSDEYRLEMNLILRILDVLDEISPGPRLLMIIGHLTRYPEKHVASKAALLVGRRLQSREWVERHLASTDSRVRANVVESLWSVNSVLAAQTFRHCLLDENNRVRGNALVGMHLMGDQSVGWRVRQLTKDSRPRFRQTAAWVIGRLGEPELVPTLEGLLRDSDRGVRQSAANALERLRATVASIAGLDLSPDAETTSVLVSPEAENELREPVEAAPEIAMPTSGELPLHVPDQEGQHDTVLTGHKQPPATFNLRLDGRYITGD